MAITTDNNALVICDNYSELASLLGSLPDGISCFCKETDCTYVKKNGVWVNTTGTGGASSWGAITGVLSNQIDLQTVLNSKLDLISSFGYTINVQAITSSPADGATTYFGLLPKAPITTANVSKVHIRKAGTIKIANIYCYSGTAGTAEAWSLYIRKNNTTDTLIATVSSATNERVFSNSSLSISVSAGDYIEIKSVQPTWVTNPLTTIFGGYIYIE